MSVSTEYSLSLLGRCRVVGTLITSGVIGLRTTWVFRSTECNLLSFGDVVFPALKIISLIAFSFLFEVVWPVGLLLYGLKIWHVLNISLSSLSESPSFRSPLESFVIGPFGKGVSLLKAGSEFCNDLSALSFRSDLPVFPSIAAVWASCSAFSTFSTLLCALRTYECLLEKYGDTLNGMERTLKFSVRYKGSSIYSFTLNGL